MKCNNDDDILNYSCMVSLKYLISKKNRTEPRRLKYSNVTKNYKTGWFRKL